MPKYYISVALVRLVMPAALLFSMALRPFGMSMLYLLLYLWLPLVPMPDSKSFSGWRGRSLLMTFLVSLLMLLGHAAWHVFLASAGGAYGTVLVNCTTLQEVAQNVGLVGYDAPIDILMAVQLLAPELVMTVTSLTVWLVVRKLLSGNTPEEKIIRDEKHQNFPFLTSAGKYMSLLLLMAAGIARPSLTSGAYFALFVGAATAWAAGRELARGFALACRCAMALMALHTTTLLLYQCSYLVALLPATSIYARVAGLMRLVDIDCRRPREFSYVDAEWTTYASPAVILFTYFVLALETRELFKPKAKKKQSTFGKLEAGRLNGSLARGMSFRRLGSARSAHGAAHAHDRWRAATNKVRVACPYIDRKTLRTRGSASERTPLIRGMSPSRRPTSRRSVTGLRGLHQDSTGSVIVPDEESLGEAEPPGLMDEIILAIVEFFQVLIRYSYIATSITMMAWSIMYHSWLTFVLLMWANVMWLRQNQRSFMLNSSPVLVFYALFLLLSQYIYGMDLTEEELPSHTKGVNLAQIGFTRPEREACVPLLIKSLLTGMFWITLRQRNQEAAQRKQSSTIADMVAPLQLTVSTAASVIEQQEEYQRSRLLEQLGVLLKSFCTRYWIYVVVVMLFVIGVTGERMTIFRILYMFLFLAFILLFQISYRLWRRLMYAFWIVLIMYSMANLVLVYIYQFDNFPQTIRTYLKIPVKLQYDLGLEKYNKADLFVRLLTPTCFLVITIMQVHYFHKDFLVLSKLKSRASSMAREDSARRQSGVASTIKDDLPGLSSEEEAARAPGADAEPSELEQSAGVSSLHRRSTRRSNYSRKLSRSKSYAPTVTEHASVGFRECALMFAERARRLYAGCRDLAFLYLEIHLIKIVFVALMLLCVLNVCALHVPIMLIISPALLLNGREQRLCVLLTSLIVSAYFMAKMIYQIEYIPHNIFEVNCSVTTGSGENETVQLTTYNNAEWVGFVKKRALPRLLKGYITVIALFTVHSLVMYRQQRFRSFGLSGPNKDKIMFPDVTRKEADQDLLHCIKYLVNYGFYKFGVEITLICLMGVIGSRMDLYAVLYAGWLVALVWLPRERQACVWPVFTGFVAVLLPLQYAIAVGFLPQFCIQYPWGGDDKWMQQLRYWLFLPYADEPPHATKIIFDYVLLVFCALQRRVFQLERRHGDAYLGGSNSHEEPSDWETRAFVNPVPDFLATVGTWLDIVKRLIFLGMLWVTLAIMFLTGTNRVNLFSIGYLIGSFIFLWQGTDFYLRPKDAILKWWSWLLGYNVGVVAVKTLLQIPGCLFNTLLQERACWLVQLLGIGCVDKFAGGDFHGFLRMQKYINKESTCAVPQEDIGLAWDGVCFAFLLLQRRFFYSYYFYRVIDESKATTVLASRGAELIEELRQKQMRQQENQESKILEKIKVKMERIKANQKKIQGPSFPDAPHHDAGPGQSSGPIRRRVFKHRHQEAHFRRPTYQKTEPSSHQKAVRSGDYYMFDEFDDVDIDSIKPDEESSDEDVPKEMGIGKLLSTVFKTDIRRAMSLRRASAPSVRPVRHLSVASDHTYPPHAAPQWHSRGEPSEPTQPAMVDILLPERHERDGGGSELAIEPPQEETVIDKLKRFLGVAWAFVESFLVTMTRHLLRYSRDYRYISKALFNEKKILKEKEHFGIGIREGSQMIWQPLPEALLLRSSQCSADAPHTYRIAATAGRHLSPQDCKDASSMDEQEDSLFQKEQSPFLHLLCALWYAILSHTDIVCYLMVFINQIQSATILSIPLPLMVFLWGTLTIPRPTKTFWVTLIAYTEVIVLVKSMFQFDVLPWNQKVVPANLPFTAARVIGIERKHNYALYDLLLLLIIFLHRFMLKSLGLWKETSPEIELREDTLYPLNAEDTKMLVEGEAEEVGRMYADRHARTGGIKRQARAYEDSGSQVEEAELEEEAQNRVVSVPAASQELTSVELVSERDGPRRSTSTQTMEKLQLPGTSRDQDGEDHRSYDDQEPIISVTTALESPGSHCPQIIKMAVLRYLSPVHQFFVRMLDPAARVTADVYAYMFLCDFFNFLVVIFGFAAFGTHQGDGGVQAYLQENKVPIPFLVMLILQFALIIIDRALYLRKFILGKILFQYGLIIGVHIWMFFVLPFITERTFNSLLPPPMWYMVKCVYLLLSAYQIRCGYPRRIIGNFLCKGYNYINMFLFRGFMAVPFVFELRTLMDWVWTDTSMTLMDWLKMEDIFANIFLLKCSRYVEDEFPQPRGTKKTPISKYLMGGTVLAFIIAIIWFPLVLFAFGNTVGKSNPPTDVTVKIRIGPFLPAYQMTAQSHNIDLFSQQDYDQLSNLYSKDRTAQTFLSNYMYDDIAAVTLNADSTAVWAISPPELQRLKDETFSNESLTIKMTFVLTHLTNSPDNPPSIEDERPVELKAFINGTRNPQRKLLYEMLAGNTSTDDWLLVKGLLPKFVKVFNKGQAKPAYQLIRSLTNNEDEMMYRNVLMQLETMDGTRFWRVKEDCTTDAELNPKLKSIAMNDCNKLVMYTFNDKLFPETLNFISGSGIIGLYTTFVFLASRILRGFFSGIYSKIMFDDLPNVDRVLQMCLDIYLVREALELALEEDLFAKLVFLYRSPETMIKWTRPKDEPEERAAIEAPPAPAPEPAPGPAPRPPN